MHPGGCLGFLPSTVLFHLARDLNSGLELWVMCLRCWNFKGTLVHGTRWAPKSPGKTLEWPGAPFFNGLKFMANWWAVSPLDKWCYNPTLNYLNWFFWDHLAFFPCVLFLLFFLRQNIALFFCDNRQRQVLVYSYGYIGQLQMLFCWLMFFWVPSTSRRVVVWVSFPMVSYTINEYGALTYMNGWQMMFCGKM